MKINKLLLEFSLSNKKDTISLDLGCGYNPRNPLNAETVIGVDILTSPFKQDEFVKYIPTSIGSPLPISDSIVDVVTCYDFLEHIPRVGIKNTGPNPFIEMMNEIYRVLKPGGYLVALTPCYPHSATFSDPTHVNPITATTHEYFTGHNFAKSMGYGFKGEFSSAVIRRLSPIPGAKIWESYAISENKQEAPISFLKVFWRNFLFFRNSTLNFFSPETHSHILWILRKETI